ncbi:SDR family NAD(P)-dependent oxidoreductase [Microbacterium immunditiarum]|uniref:3-oxoacyl-[acyl-carrier protein] reductase n=1 Tax=Microbacterium immunditiarum TaxID=337480 RepID=A0A7Y9GLR1_9MICO|nr:SDR family oxidoreductase [Microbacterium immunditiarum]NYE18812.1 3-oxoacyl-[acyl-carrier protein] reductase [Microbacterium immunditiarum]
MDLGIASRAYIITGASAGIGKATAEILAQEGASVLLCARGEERLRGVVETLGRAERSVRGLAIDVADPASAEKIRDAALEAFGRIDGVVSAAGMSTGEHLRDFSDESWMQAYQVNTLSAIRLAMTCVPVMRERGWGRIVTVGSTAGRTADPRFASYGAAKAALMNATRALSRAYSKYGILANCVMPGLTKSESVLAGYESAAKHMGVTADDVEHRMLQLEPIAMGRTGTPDEVARMIVFLASAASSWTTGVNIQVDGGTLRDLP